MPDVTGTVVHPDGTPYVGRVEFALVDAGGAAVPRGWLDASTVAGVSVVRTDANGMYTVTLPDGTAIAPGDTRWRRRLLDTPTVVSDLLDVPAGGGREEDLVVDAVPAPPAASELPRGRVARTVLAGAPNTSIATTSATFVDIPGLAATVTIGARPCSARITATCLTFSATAKLAGFGVAVDGVDHGPTAPAIAAVAGEFPLVAHLVDLSTVAAGEHTIQGRWRIAGGATVTAWLTEFFGTTCEVALEVIEW